MSTFYTRTRTASTPVDPQGVYTGTVTRVDDVLQQVWVEVARLTPGFQFGPLSVVGASLPAVGDRVAVQFVENRTNDMLVIGVVRTPLSADFVPPVLCTSSTRPLNPRIGTIIFEADTLNLWVWTGAVWSPSRGGGEILVEAGEVSGSYTLDLTAGNFFTMTVVGDTTLSMGGAVGAGQVGRFTVEMRMGSTFYPVTWPSSFQWSFGLGALAPDVNSILTVSGYSVTAGDEWLIRITDFI